jgi:Caspase domain
MRRALLIGSQTGGLRGVHADVEVMADTLGELGFSTIELTEKHASYGGIVDAYRGLIEDSATGDAAVVYYSGHGGRCSNAKAAEDPREPPWLQYLIPTNYGDRDAGEFSGLLAEELSALQWELTEKTKNVTTILDCCHSARMSRDFSLLPKARERAGGLPWEPVHARWEAVRSSSEASGIDLDSNPVAVRVVACAPDQSAYELDVSELGGPHGALTATIVPLLREARAARLTWHQLLDALRPAVMDLIMLQRPEVEGPSERYLFATDEREATGVLPVVVEGGAAYLEAAALFGVGAGDTYAVVAAGGDPRTPLGTAVVEAVVAGRARLALEGIAAEGLPAGAEAHPREVALGRRPVAVRPVDDPDRRRVVEALRSSPHLRVVDDAPGLLAAVELGGGELRLLDGQGEPLSADSRPVTDGNVMLLSRDVQQLARAAHLRDLESGSGKAELPADVTIKYTLLTDRGEVPVQGSGEHLFEGDRLVIRIRNESDERRYVSVFDIGLRGTIALLTTSEPSGISLAPGASHELYRAVGGLTGIPLFWPEGLPKGGPRPEAVVSIVTDRPQDLRRLSQPGVARTRGDADSALQRLVESVNVGRRDALPETEVEDVVRYRVERFDFLLHPTARVAADEPAFELDDRPDPSFRLVVPRAAEALPARVAVRLREVVVHSNRALLSSSVRVDAMLVTRSDPDGDPYQAATARFDRVRDGDRLPLDNLLVYEGPVGGFVDLAVWVARDDRRGLDLAELLRQEATGKDVKAAVAALVGLAIAAPQAAVAAASVAAVATLIRTGARVLDAAVGKSIGVYRTSLLPHERFGAGDPVGRHPESGLLRAQDMSFAYEVIALEEGT